MKSAQVKIREDGSIPIPKELLEGVKMKPNDEVIVFEQDGHLVVMTREQLADEIVRLLEPIKDADWEQIEKEREDDPQRV